MTSRCRSFDYSPRLDTSFAKRVLARCLENVDSIAMEKLGRSVSEESDSLVSFRHRCLYLFKGILDIRDYREGIGNARPRVFVQIDIYVIEEIKARWRFSFLFTVFTLNILRVFTCHCVLYSCIFKFPVNA